MISINQPYFFANIGYFSLMEQSQIHVFYDDVNMRKKSWISRNKFTKDETLYSLKIVNLSQNRKISEHKIIDPIKTLNDIIHLLEKNRLEHINEAVQLLSECKNNLPSEITVSEFNILTTLEINNALGIKCKCVRSSLLENTKMFTSDERLVKITQDLGGYGYLNLESGDKLYNKERFNREGIKLYLNNTQNLKQVLKAGEFYKSILFLISRYGLDRVKSIISNYASFSEVVS